MARREEEGREHSVPADEMRLGDDGPSMAPIVSTPGSNSIAGKASSSSEA